jgi:hypothetical protein
LTEVNTRIDRRLPFVALCLMLFQCQVFAASALGCLHVNAAPNGAADGVANGGRTAYQVCPHHARAGVAAEPGAPDQPAAQPFSAATLAWSGAVADGVAGQAASGDLLDCAKCALNCSVSHYDRAPAGHALPPPPAAGAAPALPIRHFYRYSPESFLRPPIPAAV